MVAAPVFHAQHQFFGGAAHGTARFSPVFRSQIPGLLAVDGPGLLRFNIGMLSQALVLVVQNVAVLVLPVALMHASDALADVIIQLTAPVDHLCESAPVSVAGLVRIPDRILQVTREAHVEVLQIVRIAAHHAVDVLLVGLRS